MRFRRRPQGKAYFEKRVKVYRFSEDNKWEDEGTGYITVDYLEPLNKPYIQRTEEAALFVFDEEDEDALLLHRISPDDIYRRDQDTIIFWRDPEYCTEIAISFQEATGCNYVWDRICNEQRNIMRLRSLNIEEEE